MVVLALQALAAAVLVAWLIFGRRLAAIAAQPSLSRRPLPADGEGGDWPTLAVIVPCRNEAASVEAAMRSLLAQRYPRLQVVAVDDRSTDATGAILDRLAAAEPRLRVEHVTALPAGWLGKTHAMSRGAASVPDAAWLLFTDADVMFAPDALARAVAWARHAQLGHGVALPHFVAPGFLERSFVALFGLFFLVHLRADDLRRAGSRAHVGMGAFNLVRADAYRAIGGHDRLRMEVVDDVKLGLLLRRGGARQGCVDSGGLVRVRWQRGFRASMRGLVKNMFAGTDYRWTHVLRHALLLPVATVFPAACLLLSRDGLLRAAAGAALLVSVALHGAVARRLAFGRGHEGVTLPLAGVCLAAVLLASALATTLRRGVLWRGTRYPLSELKAACVRDADWPADRAPG